MDKEKYTFYAPRGNHLSIFGSPDESLEDAIRKAGVQNFSFENHVLFAQLNDQPNEIAVRPGILCRELKPGGKITAEGHKGATPRQKTKDDSIDENENNKENKPKVKTQQLFFIESTKLKGITKIPHSNYNGRLLAVVAYDGDKVEDAVVKDGRFSEGVMLFETDERGAEVPLHYPVADVARQIFTMRKRPAKRKKNLQMNDTPSSTNIFSIPGDLKGHFTETIGRAAIDSVRQNALEHFSKPGVHKSVDECIRKGMQNFGKEKPGAIPAQILDTLARAKKSVGNIHCGDITGTCFILAVWEGKCAIITCKHVINMIMKKRDGTTDRERYSKIWVHFDDNYPEQTGDCVGEVDENEEKFHDEHLDYAIMFLKPAPGVNDLPTLGPFVRSSVPCHGVVALIGYPANERKSMDVCHIIPAYKWHATLYDRAAKAARHCEENPHECRFHSSQDIECIHMHKDDIQRDTHANEIPYDTSFFHGSSGSPVFNSDGHIIAIHTLGYPYLRGATKYSIMEFGKVLGAICRDVRSKHGDVWANLFFPDCGN